MNKKERNKYIKAHPPSQGDFGYYVRMAEQLGITAEAVRSTCRRYNLPKIVPHIIKNNNNIMRDKTDLIEQKLISLLKIKQCTVEELSNELKILPFEIRQLVKKLQSEKYNVNIVDDKYELSSQVATGSPKKLDIKNWQGDILKFGFVSDTHLGSKFERIDVLNALYDLYENEGIDTVYHGGNIIDGECYFNKYEIHTRGMTPQVEYCINNYPTRKGVKTLFITGDDHEGWYIQRERINIGEYIQMKAERIGRSDLIYIGHVEADIGLGDGDKSWMRIMHGGGGTAYALSYTPQKIVESYQGGEKPRILLLGHYHKIDYCFPREVHVVQMGCVEDQTIFMRKKKIQAHIGGGILEIRQAPDGSINRIKVEYITFFDKGFYKGKDKYWK